LPKCETKSTGIDGTGIDGTGIDGTGSSSQRHDIMRFLGKYCSIRLTNTNEKKNSGNFANLELYCKVINKGLSQHYNW